MSSPYDFTHHQQASVRCLAYRGRFLEIGKFDISNNTSIGMYFFLKETSFHGIMLDYIFDQSYEFRKVIIYLFSSSILNLRARQWPSQVSYKFTVTDIIMATLNAFRDSRKHEHYNILILLRVMNPYLNSISYNLFLEVVMFYNLLSFFLYQRLQDLLLSGIDNGAVRPLTYCTFEANEIESAFRYMAAGKHIGKVRYFNILIHFSILLYYSLYRSSPKP